MSAAGNEPPSAICARRRNGGGEEGERGDTLTGRHYSAETLALKILGPTPHRYSSQSRIRPAIPVFVGLLCLSAPLWAQIPPGEPPPGPLVQRIAIEGATVFTPDWLTGRHGLGEGTRLTRSTDEIARGIRDQYRDDGYTFATVDASLDDASGTLTITIDEAVRRHEVVGVGARANAHPGELPHARWVFNASRPIARLRRRWRRARRSRASRGRLHVLKTAAGACCGGLRARDRARWIFGTMGTRRMVLTCRRAHVGFGLHGTVFDKVRSTHLMERVRTRKRGRNGRG